MTRIGLLVRLALAVPAFALLLAFGGAPALAQYANVEIVVKDKKFEPAEVKAPANARIVIHVTNKDAVAMEFESKSLKVEKVIAPKSEGILRVGPLKPGRYEFFDDFNQNNRGTLVVQ
jgi:heme/copper-type cytochrome/quinol oxidase subunit 2